MRFSIISLRSKPYLLSALLLGCLGCASTENSEQKQSSHARDTHSVELDTVSSSGVDPVVLNVEEVEKDIVAFFQHDNAKNYNRFVDEKLGVTILFSIGVSPEYIRLDSLSGNPDFYTSKNIPFWVAEQIVYNLHQVEVDSLIEVSEPVFQCEEVLQYGSFIEKGKELKVMTESIKILLNDPDLDIKGTDYVERLRQDSLSYWQLEGKSIRVIVTNERVVGGKSPISIFHFTKKNGRMYVVLMDFESYNCSV